MVWDVFTFFQKPFVGALKDYRCGQCQTCKSKPQEHCLKAPWNPENLDRIAEMKLHRGHLICQYKTQSWNTVLTNAVTSLFWYATCSANRGFRF